MKNIEFNILSLFQHIVTPERIEILARTIGFVKRSSSQLKGPELVEVLAFPSKCHSEESLNGLSDRIRSIIPGTDLSASALCQRINSSSCSAFLKKIFQEILQRVRKYYVQTCSEYEQSFLSNFSEIYIEDSTYIALNEKLREFYPGTGSIIKSQMKIDFIHNFKNEQIIDMHLTRGNLPDQGLSERILSFIGKGDLVIRDLGYFKLDVLKAIAEKGSYYLSRLPSNVLVYLKAEDQEPVDLDSFILKKMKKNKPLDLNVFIGANKMPTRLVIYKLPKKVAQQIAEAEIKKSKGRSRQTSSSKTSLMKYGIFITNADQTIMPAEIVGTIYRIRWNIELIFKQWKSQLKIQYIKGTNENRVHTLIYGRLILILFLSVLMQWAMERARKLYGKELSFVKLLDYLNRGERLAKALRTGELDKLLKQLLKDMPRRLCKDTRCRLTLRERVKRNTYYYNDEKKLSCNGPNKTQSIRDLGKNAA